MYESEALHGQNGEPVQGIAPAKLCPDVIIYLDVRTSVVSKAVYRSLQELLS